MGEKVRNLVEICCGSFYDAKQAAFGGAERIELNSGLVLGGLTPTVSTLRLVKEQFPKLKVIAMVRPRGAGFCYTEDEFQVMEAECQELMQNGADGIAFGCLNEDATLNLDYNRRMVSIIKGMGGEAVFHRAFDCTVDPFVTIEQLIDLGVDRVLTSGFQQNAIDGVELIGKLQERYGDRIEILAGGGVNIHNAGEIIQRARVRQVHSPCKAWVTDLTTVKNGVSYSIFSGAQEFQYDVVSSELVKELLQKVCGLN